MDFYTSPISIEVDGVDVKLRVLAPDAKSKSSHATNDADTAAAAVPNTVDLAQSFLETQPSSERRRLEAALAAETQDLGASMSMSDDDGAEDEPALGTGQPLSLPGFLAGFLQGIVDRMQIKIKGVGFQLDMDIPVDMHSSVTEPVSFQIALEGIDIEGVTTRSEEPRGSTPVAAPKQGKRQISLDNVRAYLISEANLFSALTRTSSMTSPSAATSPLMTRNPPSRETTSVSLDSPQMPSFAPSIMSSRREQLDRSSPSPRESIHSQHMATSQASIDHEFMPSLQASFRHHLADAADLHQPNYPLGDSEEALGIPYEFEDREDDGVPDDESPATPRASLYQDFNNSPDNPAFHSPEDPEMNSSPATRMFESGLSRSQDALDEQQNSPSVHSISRQPVDFDPSSDVDDVHSSTELGSQGHHQLENLAEDLSQSHLYTHEEAESMYMSAFSNAGNQSVADVSDLQSSKHSPPPPPSPPAVEQITRSSPEPTMQSPRSPPTSPRRAAEPATAMPGGWDDNSSQGSSASDRTMSHNLVAEERSAAAESERPEPQAEPEPVPETKLEQEKPGSPAFHQSPKAQDRQMHLEEEPQHEDVATPKGPTRVVKEILHLQSISIYVPTTHQHVELEEDTSESVAELARAMGNSVYPQAPGAFSVHAPASSSSYDFRPSPIQPTQSVDAVLEVDLSPVSIRFDASLAFVLAMIVGKLLEAVKNDHPVKVPSKAAEDGQQADKTPEIKVNVQEISLDFLSRLGGVTDTPHRHLDPSAFMFDHEVLLNATLGNLAISVAPVKVPAHSSGRSKSDKQEAIQTRIDLETFRFGYTNGDIISFDKARPMSTSVRDTFLSNGHDIAIKMTQTKDSVRTEVETLPLAVQIDLQRLDETFSWFGGLSSFLNMSASMTSSPSPTPKPPPKPAASQRPRGVRFDTPINPDDKSAASENKVNVRIGGGFIELLGKECSFVAESNAIKLISREEGIGIGCSTMRVSGPYLKNSMADAAINTEIKGVRLEFVTTPNDADLEKLLELITPSKAKFDGSDEIMVDTLLRQRRKGSVLRAGVEALNVRVKNLAQLEVLPTLAEEMAKLSTVAKYLPEDDRPGLMTLAKIHKLHTSVDLGGSFGLLSGDIADFEAGHITVPSLVAVAVSGISVRRNKTEELISSSVLYASAEIASRGPVIMARMIGDDIEPVVKLNLSDISIEYRVPTIMDLLGLAKDATPQDFEESLAASVASLGDQAHAALARQPPRSPTEATAKQSKPLTLDVSFRDCLIGLNPLNQKSKMVLVFTDVRLAVALPKDEVTNVSLDINKASILLTDDASLATSDNRVATNSRRRASSSASPQVVSMCAQGFVDICYMSSAKVTVNIAPDPDLDGEKQVQIEVRDDLLVLETCADSTQTLISLANALSPPTPPSKENKYRTNVMPVQDLLASISAEAFGKPEGEYDFDQDFAGAQEMATSQSDAGFGSDGSLRVESQFYGDESGEELFDAMKLSGTSQEARMQDTNEGVLITGLDPPPSYISEDSDDLVIHDDFYNRGNTEEHAAKIWNSTKNTYDKAPAHLVKRSPLKVSVRDVHLIWNLFDGYDWIHTRDVISKAVHDVEAKVYERQARLGGGQQVYEEEIEDEETIGDFLFNSIYIGIPANRDPQELARAINEGLADNATETESIATTAVTATTNRTVRRGYPKSRRLKLQRSKHHKITFELQGVNVDMVAFPAGTGETQSSIDVRVQNLDIFDHVPTSTWKKFVTYDQDQGEREMGTSMVHLELLTVKPLPELGASEIVLRATVLPLRLHVDQDALDFITRFFEFKDDSVPVHSSPSDVPFLQRAEVNDIPVKLDFKPKRVDYAGLRSGHTTEFMNFITLEESRMVLRHVIIYGVSGFDRLGKTLNDIWTPDVRSNQLPGVLGGLAPVRSLVNIGSGFKDLVEIPLKEYQKDGRIIRSISKGAAAFARTTGTELVKFGAKLAVGTQYALQGAEEMLSAGYRAEEGWEDDDLDAEDKKQISLYADHPTGVIQGIRGGYRSLARDVNLARDAIIAVPGEVMVSQSASSAAKAVLRRAPTIIFRPAVGVTKAIGQTLMGATNSIDPHNQRRIDEVLTSPDMIFSDQSTLANRVAEI